MILKWSLKHNELQTQDIQLEQKQVLCAYRVSKYDSVPGQASTCTTKASVGHIPFAVVWYTLTLTCIYKGFSHCKRKRWRGWGKGGQRVIIHLQICWVLYQNICSSPTTHLYKPIMKPKAIVISHFHFWFPSPYFSSPLCMTHLSCFYPFIQRKGVSPDRLTITGKQTG